MTTPNPTPTQQGETLLPCPLCGSTDLFLRDIAGWELDCQGCELSLVLADDPSREGLIRRWNTRAAVAGPRGDALLSDDDTALLAHAITIAREVQEFIWADCYPALRPYDAEGWRRLFQKRVDCIAEIDLTKHGGLAALRKRLLQQAALSIKALALVNRWAKTNPPQVSTGGDGSDLRDAATSPPTPAESVGAMTPEQLERAALIAESRGIDLETAQELVYLRDAAALRPERTRVEGEQNNAR